MSALCLFGEQRREFSEEVIFPLETVEVSGWKGETGANRRTNSFR